jgi:hypothetical protein
MMARPHRQLPIIQRAQFAAEDLLGDRHAIFVEHPLRQIDQPPAHDLIEPGDRTGLDLGDERAPLFVIELGGTPGGFVVRQPTRPLGVEPKHPIAKGLTPDPSQPGRVSPRAAVINRHKRQKASRDAPRLFRKSQGAKHRPVKISA